MRGEPKMANKRLPVEVGQKIDVRIESIGEKGDGVAKVNGYAVFVPGSKEGQELKVEIRKTFKKFAFAEIISDAEIEEF